jgi:hypothetical protein
MFDLPQIGERIRTQDNRFTADPIFLVQERHCYYGVDVQYDPPIAWLYEDESVEVAEDLAKSLETAYQHGEKEPDGYCRVGYHETWEFVQPFFTEAAAELYIKQNGHRHRGSLRTYVDCAFRNYEWQTVRKYLMELPA